MTKPLKIYVDADACPVKDEVLKVASRHGVLVVLVSNRWHRGMGPLVEQIVVPEDPDAADIRIAAEITENDIVITADIPLVARCIEKNAYALNHNGKPFTEASIGMTLAMRDLMTGLRETSDFKSYNPSFTNADRSRFLSALETLVQSALRAKG